MRFVLSVLCCVLLCVVGLAGAPSKVSLETQYLNLPGKNQPQAMVYAQSLPVKSLAMQTLPSETLPAQQGATLETQTLPVINTETSETLPEQTLLPLQATYLQPNYRTQDINQEVIQPIYKTEPVLQVHHITQNVYRPTLQKQPVIQPIITQPVLHRVIHNQPIIQQQLQQQTVVKRRVIAQPRVVQRLETQYSTAPKQIQTEYGQAYQSISQPNPKVAALSSPISPSNQPAPSNRQFNAQQTDAVDPSDE